MPTLEEVIQKRHQCNRLLNDWYTSLAERRGAKKQIESAIQREQLLLDKARDEQLLCQHAHLFLMAAVTERRDSAIKSIEALSTSALHTVYGSGYQLSFDTGDEKRQQEGANSFKMQILITSPWKDNEKLCTGLEDERGFGVMEMSSYALRVAALEWLGYEGPLLMDETHRSIDIATHIDSVADFIRRHIDERKRQVIFVTHMAKQFGPIADRIFKIEKQPSGLAKVTMKINSPIRDRNSDEYNGETYEG